MHIRAPRGGRFGRLPFPCSRSGVEVAVTFHILALNRRREQQRDRAPGLSPRSSRSPRHSSARFARPLSAISGHQLRLKHLPIIGNDLCFQMLFRKRLVTSHALFVGNDLWDPTHRRGRLHCRFNGNYGGRSRPAPSTDSELGCGRGSATRVH